MELYEIGVTVSGVNAWDGCADSLKAARRLAQRVMLHEFGEMVVWTEPNEGNIGESIRVVITRVR